MLIVSSNIFDFESKKGLKVRERTLKTQKSLDSVNMINGYSSEVQNIIKKLCDG